ncbi:LSU ribosomal protein L10p (P0) [Olavius algarvensis associated proteobacterium Delta 3]|nr:LSU ribosomal protein L10p (P0) [Olavius algarvensis associated proteobacterium Delta 3]CAB5108355.1 LSU ribosomal protein L10p (P0) [Olavius algarvensis associated proteobacterium Delta 3]
MKRETKQRIVEELHDKFTRSKVLILTDYMGLNVEDMNALRSKLRESEIEFKVVKNTLLKRAAEGTDAAHIVDSFKGPSAIALSYDDPVAPAKVLTDFAKEHKKLEIKIGEMDGNVLDVAAIKSLSQLPSREVLLAKLLSVCVAVPTGFVTALSGVPRNFLNVLQAIKDQKEAA